MPATFSINNGTITEATRKTSIQSVLNDIQDNTQKLISPRDVRDAFLTTWANTPFKVTIPNSLSNLEYIGIDSTNPSNRDIKNRIFIGKRSFGNLDIMTPNLLNSSTDIFFFNTKNDSDNQNSTKISILAGTNSTLYNNAPYIESLAVDTVTDLNIINPAPNGAINLLSTTGRVAINGVIFPTQAETGASASNGKILRYRGVYPSGSLKWEHPTITFNTIGTTGSPTNIYGSTVSVNGYSLEFVDNNLVSATMGGVPLGFSFSQNTFNGQNWPLSEVLRKVLYPYVPPVLSLLSSNNATSSNGYRTSYAEVGVTTPILITYSITSYARNIAEKVCSYQILGTTVLGQSFSGVPGTNITLATPNVSTASTIGVKTWTLQVSDSGLLNSWSYSVTTTIEFVNPIYYGLTSSLSSTASSTLTKAILPYPGVGNSIDLSYLGTGYLYFSHNQTFAPLKQIKDPNGFILYDSQYPQYSSFTSSNVTLPIVGSSSFYTVYRLLHETAWPRPTQSGAPQIGPGIFKFIF